MRVLLPFVVTMVVRVAALMSVADALGPSTRSDSGGGTGVGTISTAGVDSRGGSGTGSSFGDTTYSTGARVVAVVVMVVLTTYPTGLVVTAFIPSARPRSTTSGRKALSGTQSCGVLEGLTTSRPRLAPDCQHSSWSLLGTHDDRAMVSSLIFSNVLDMLVKLQSCSWRDDSADCRRLFYIRLSTPNPPNPFADHNDVLCG